MDAKTRVYYNSACPVCNAGIEAERRGIDRENTARIEWIDVHTAPHRTSELDVGLELVRERLHVRTADGKLQVGFDAIIALLAQRRGRKWLAAVFALPLVHALGVAAYDAFARRLYGWNRKRGHW